MTNFPNTDSWWRDFWGVRFALPGELRVCSNSLKSRMDDQCFCSRIAFVCCCLNALRNVKTARDGYHEYHVYQRSSNHVPLGGSPYIGRGILLPGRQQDQ